MRILNVTIEPDNLSFLIRKAAHMFEFFILGLLVFNMYKKNFIISKAYLLTLIHGIMVASLDEFIQTFSEGRAGLWSDVLIDTLGVLISLLILKGYTIYKVLRHSSK